LTAHGREALVRLFPIPRGASANLKKVLQGVGNRFLVAPANEWALKDRLKNGPSLPPEALASHFVDSDAMGALRSGDLETFVQRRAAAMEEWDCAEWKAFQQADPTHTVQQPDDFL
jgi:hypothetical protein